MTKQDALPPVVVPPHRRPKPLLHLAVLQSMLRMTGIRHHCRSRIRETGRVEACSRVSVTHSISVTLNTCAVDKQQPLLRSDTSDVDGSGRDNGIEAVVMMEPINLARMALNYSSPPASPTPVAVVLLLHSFK